MLSGDSSQSVPPMSLISSQSDRFFLHFTQFSIFFIASFL